MLYFVEYDLRNQRDYSKLYEALQSLGAIQVLESTYCFEYDNTSAGAIHDHLKQFIDSDDGLAVTQVADWATYNTTSNPNQLRNVPR